MVRETRYLWIGNLPEGITEQRLTELFARHGRVQSVKLHRPESDKPHAVLAFMDIKSAAKAHNSENVIDGLIVETQYNEPTVVSVSGLPAGHSHEASPLQLPSGRPPGTTLSAPEQLVWNTASSSSSTSSASSSSTANPSLNSCLGNGPQVSRDDRHYHHQHNNQHHHHHHHNHHHANSGTYSSSRCHQKPPQKVAPELSNGNCVGNGEKGCIRSTFALSESCPSSSGKMLMDLLSDRRFQCGRCSPKQHLASALCTENGLKKSLHLGGGGGSGGGPIVQENKAICVQGFPANLSDACIKDGLHHQYRKVGKVLSVVVTGQKDERCGIVTFLKREDVLQCLEGGTTERQFLNHPVTISEHEGFGEHGSKRVDMPHDEFHHKATRTLYVGNLELSVTKEQLQQIFRKYGFLIDIELKNQGQSTSAHAYLQYDSISSVVHAVKDMHSKYIGNNLIKLGYGKTQPTNCLLVDRIVETVSEKILRRLFARYGQVVHIVIDKESRRCLVYYDSSKHAQRALTELQGKALAGKRIQIDFASKECQSVFYKKLERSGHSVAKHSSATALHRPIASLSSHVDHGRVLRDIGLEVGPSQATDSSERLSGGALPHGRSQRPSDNQNREAVAETQTLVSDYGVERQRSSGRTSADGGASSSIHIPADGDYGRVRLKDPELRISETNCGARQNSLRKNCVTSSCEMLLNDRDRHLEKPLVSQGKASAIQPPNSSVTSPSSENNGPHDRLGRPKTPPESSTPDLKAVFVSSDAHRKPVLSEQLTRQSSHSRLDGPDCHGPAEEQVGGGGKTSGGACSSHSPTDRREGERRTFGDCDGHMSKRDCKEPPVVSDKLEDAPVEFPRSRLSKSGPSCKNAGEHVTRIGSQYSIVSSTFADLKSDTSAKSVAKAHHVTMWSAPDNRRPTTVEGKHSKSRIPETRSSLSGTTVNSSTRNSQKFPGVEHGRPTLEDPSGPGTNGSLAPAKHFVGERSGETYGDAPSHLSSSTISAGNATAPEESMERNRRRSDMVDIDNLHQMKRYYMTKYRKLEEFRGTGRSSAEPNSEKTELHAVPTPVRPLDQKQSRCLSDLTVPWCERPESGEITQQEDPRTLSARTFRVMSASFISDLNPSGPGAEVSKRGRALSLPLPKFAHWTRTSSNDHDTKKRRLSVETSHLHSFSKPVCSAGILSPHHSPNPVKLDNVSFGFFPNSRTVDGIISSKTDGVTDEVGSQSVVEMDKNCGKAEDSFSTETNINDENLSVDVARDVGIDPEKEPLAKPSVPETLETDLMGSCYLTVHDQTDPYATDLNNSVASLVSELEKQGSPSKNDKPEMEDSCSDSVSKELESEEAKTVCEDDILSNEKQLLDHSVVKSSCDNFECSSDVNVNSESSIKPAIHLIATTEANSNSGGEEVALSKTEIETESEASVDKPVADLDAAEQHRNEPNLNVALEAQEVSLSLVQGSGVSAVLSVDLVLTTDNTLSTDAQNNSCDLSRSDEGPRTEELDLVKRQDFDEKLVEAEIKLDDGSCRIIDENGVPLKNKECVGSVNNSVEESPKSGAIENPKSEIVMTVLLNDESSEKPKIALTTHEKTMKNTHEIAGQKHKADVLSDGHNQARRKNSVVDDAKNDSSSKRKTERGGKEEEEVPSLAKRPKIEDTDAKRQDALKAKEHRKGSKPDKSNHSSSKISSQSLKPSTHGHSTIKKDGNDGRAAHIPNSSLSKAADLRSDTRKKSSGSSDGTSSKRAGGPPHDTAEAAGKSDFDLIQTHRKSSQEEDSRTSYSESTKSSNCVEKPCESRSTARHGEVRSDRSEPIGKSEKNGNDKSEKCGTDQNHEKKVRHETEPNTKGLADARAAEGKSVRSSNKERENMKLLDGKSQKATERRKDEKSNRIESARHVSSDRRNSAVHSTPSSVKSSGSEKKPAHRSHSAADLVKSSSTRKYESGSSLVSKGTDHSQDHRKHSQSSKHSSDSCKPHDSLTKGTSAAMENKARGHRNKPNCVSSDHAKHSVDISTGKILNESSRNVERNLKNCTEPIKKDHKLSKGIFTENIGNNPSRTADEKPSESLKQSNKSVLPAESDRYHSRKMVPEPALDTRDTSHSRKESGSTKRDKSSSKDKPSKAEYKEKLQNSREKCSSLGHGAKSVQNSKKNESVVRREKEPGFAKNSDKTVRASVARKDKSSKRPEEKRELKALLQEQDEELLLAPYMSMYDMVKRRSNKEREKEEAAKMEQLRSKTLDKLQASRSRQRKKSTVSIDENSATGSETPKNSKYKSKSSQRKSSYDEHHARQKSWAIDSSSLSSSSSSTSLDKDDEEEEEEEKINDNGDDDDDDDDDDDEVIKPSLKTPSRPRKLSKSEDSSSGSSDEGCVARQRSSSRGTKKMAPRSRLQKNWKGLSVYVTSDSEDDKREIDARLLNRESRAAVGKGSLFQLINCLSVNRENSKTTNRKEKPRKFALFSSSSSSTSTESSDCEPQANSKTWSQYSTLNSKTPVNRKDPFSVTLGSKESVISAAAGASNIVGEVAVKPSKDVRRDAEKHPKKLDDRRKSMSLGSDGGTEKHVLSCNFAAERMREPENRTKNTEEELSKQNKKLNVQKGTGPTSFDSPKPKAMKNLCRIDGLWVEEHITEKKPKPYRLPSDDKSKTKRERNVLTKTKAYDKMDRSDETPTNSFVTKPTADRTAEKLAEKSQIEAFPEMRHSGERVGCPTEPAREEGLRSSSYARLDNIFEKMEQNDGRKERDSSVDESPEDFFRERKAESKAQLEEEYERTKGKEESRETEEIRINLVPENLESLELMQDTCKKMFINPNICGNLLNNRVVASDNVILESAVEAAAVGKHDIEESWPKKSCRKSEGNSLVEVKEENEDSFGKGLALNSAGKNAVTPLADAKHYLKAEKVEVGENISKELLELDDDDDDDLCKSIAVKGEICDIKLCVDFNSACEEEMTSPGIISNLILNSKDVPVEPTAATEKNPVETVSKMPLNVKYAEEKEHLGIDEDSLEEFLVDDVMFNTVDPRTEEREYFVSRISTSELPVQFSCPMPSFRDFFVWVKPPVSAEIKPIGNDQSAEMRPAEDKPCIQPEPVASAEVAEVPVENTASSPGDKSIDAVVKDQVTMSDDIVSKEFPTAVDEAQSREGVERVPGEEEADALVESAGVVSGADESRLNPVSEVSKSRGHRPIVKNDVDKKPAAGEKSGRGVLVATGAHSTPKGAILRTRLQGNVEIVESFSSRGRKIIPKDRDRDFMQVGSKSSTKVGLNVVGRGCGRGRGRKGKFASNSIDVRPGRKSTDSLEGTDESLEIDENDEKLSARPLAMVQRRLLNFRNSCRGRRAESLCSSNFGKSNAKDVATLTIARKYGRSPSIRSRCQKSETGSAKSLVIHLNKITVPSDCGRRAAAGKGKKEEKMNVNGVKDLYEFEDEDEIGPIPEYKHKRPLKRQKDSPTANAAKPDSRTAEEEDESVTAAEPAPKRRKRTVKARSRTQPGRAASKAQRGKITTRSQANVPLVVTETESCASSGSQSAETKPETGFKNAKSSAFDEPLSQPPRHLPLKLEMKEQRQAAAVSVVSHVGSRRGPAGAFSAGDDTGSASSGSLTDASSKPSAVTEVSQFNIEKVMNEATGGSIDHQNSSEFDCSSQISSSQRDLRARDNQLEMAEEQTTMTSSCCIHDDSSDTMDATVIQQTPHRKSSEKNLNVEFQTASFEQRSVFPIVMSNETSDVSRQLSPLSVKSQDNNSLQNRPSSHEDVKLIKDQIRGPQSFESDPGDQQLISHRSPASSRSVSSDDIHLVLAQSAQLNQHHQQQPKLFQPQQPQVDSAASVSQNNVVSFLPVELIPGHHDQRWKLHAVDPSARSDAKTVPSIPLPRQAHPPTAAVAPHFADSYLASGVSGVRPDARGSHAAQSPVAGVYPQPIYSNLHLLSYLPVGVDFQSYERLLMAINQQQQQHLMSQGLIFPPGIISVPPHKGMADKGQDRSAVHGPSSASLAPPTDHSSLTSSPKMDPVALSRLIPEHSDVLFLLLKKYPVVWQGLLSLKNDFSAVQMHFIAGNGQLVKLSLPENSQLRLSQRMRLEPSQLEQVSKRMMNPNEYCMLVALPCGQDHMDIILQSNNLRAGFINYLQQKQAAGIVNIVDPVSSQTAYVVHIFPPCHFTSEHLVDQASDLLHSVNDMAYLLVVIATV